MWEDYAKIIKHTAIKKNILRLIGRDIHRKKEFFCSLCDLGLNIWTDTDSGFRPPFQWNVKLRKNHSPPPPPPPPPLFIRRREDIPSWIILWARCINKLRHLKEETILLYKAWFYTESCHNRFIDYYYKN